MLTTRVHYLIVFKKSMQYCVLESMPCIFYFTHFCVSNSKTYTIQGNWHSKQSLWTVFLFHNFKIRASICCKKKKKVSTESTWSKSFCQLLKEEKSTNLWFCVISSTFHLHLIQFSCFQIITIVWHFKYFFGTSLRSIRDICIFFCSFKAPWWFSSSSIAPKEM